MRPECCVDGGGKPSRPIARRDGRPLRFDRFCSMHRARFTRHGDPAIVVAVEERNLARGPRHPHWTEEPSYSTTHHRLRKARGLASDQQCACGGQAAQWAYTGPRKPGDREPYGELDQYEAMCVPCHKRFDLAAIGDTA